MKSTKEIAISSISDPDDLAASFAPVRGLMAAARLAGAQAAALMVLAGTELLRLHAQLEPRRGRVTKSGSVWEEAVQQHLGLSERTARRYMALAVAAKKKIPQLRAAESELMAGALPEPRRAALLRAVGEITDHRTASDLMVDWGIATRAHGRALSDSGKRGGARKGAKQDRQLAADSEQLAAEDLWAPLLRALESEVRERSYLHLTSASLDRLNGLLLDLSRALLRHRKAAPRDEVDQEEEAAEEAILS